LPSLLVAASVELAVEGVRAWSADAAAPGEPAHVDVSCANCVGTLCVGGAGLATVTPSLVVLTVLKASAWRGERDRRAVAVMRRHAIGIVPGTRSCGGKRRQFA